MAEIENISKIIEEISPHYAKKVKRKADVPSAKYNLIYDSPSETLEPLYFWILDFMNNTFNGDVEKLLDNFTSSPGSGHFAELGARATRMQEEATKILGNVNTVLKSIINIIYDLKEFEIRLEHYEEAKSKNKENAEAGLLALKQIWMDQVDIKRGRGSINMLAQDLNFITLRDAFMVAKTIEEVDKIDLNDRVKRILKPRLQEFLEWRKRSETELKKRFEIEKTYLKSQTNAIQLYSRWAKPYLKAASQLNMSEKTRPEVVNVFNTLFLELTLLGKNKADPRQTAIDKDIPQDFKEIKMKRDYYSCVLVDFNFRGIPQKVGQHYTFGGRANVTFKAYALNQNELDLLHERLKESDLNDALNLVEGATEESLNQLKEDINYFLKEESERESLEGKKQTEDVNPFLSLFGFGNKKTKPKDKDEAKIEKLRKGIKKDSYAESVMRKYAETQAADACFNIFDIYKKAHGMAAFPAPGWYEYGK